MKKTAFIILFVCSTILAGARTITRNNITYNVLSETLYTLELAKYSDQKLREIDVEGTFAYGGRNYTVTTIGKEAFSQHIEIEKVTLPNTVKAINEKAFASCTNLKEIELGASLEHIGPFAFSSCESLTDITLPDGITAIRLYAFQNCKSLTNINLPNSITTFEQGCFMGCEKLTSATLPSNIKRIEKETFKGCKSLEHVDLPDGITFIGYYAFASCKSLTSIVLPENIEEIDEAFSSCTSLTGIVIPKSLKKISGYAFLGCTAMKSVEYNAIRSESFGECFPESVETVTIGSDVEYIPLSLFNKSQVLTTVNYNARNAETAPGMYVPLFSRSVTTINIADDVEVIPANFAPYAKQLTSIILPSSVNKVGMFAFCGCGLTELHCQNPVPPTLEAEAFDYMPDCTLHVPAGSGALYAEANGWKDFYKIVEDESDSISPVTTKPSSVTRKYIDNGSIVIENNNHRYSTSGQELQ